MRAKILAASAALLVLAACEKAEDKSAAQVDNKFDLSYCAAESVEAPTSMGAGACIASPNKKFAMIMQPSGSLILAALTSSNQIGNILWSSDSKSSSAIAQLQEDGNLVVYQNQAPIWDSHTAGPKGKYTLSVTDQGNALLKNPAGQTVWGAQLDVTLCQPKIQSPAQMAVGGCLTSPDRKYIMLVDKAGALEVAPVQADGAPGKAIWTSAKHLSGKSVPPFMALQTDGNLVVYAGGKPVWNAATNGSGGTFQLELTNDGDLQLHRADGVMLWSSKAGKAKA